MYRFNVKLLSRITCSKCLSRRIYFLATFERHDEFLNIKPLASITKKFPRYTSDFIDLGSEIQIEKLNQHQTDGLLQQAMEESDNKVIIIELDVTL